MPATNIARRDRARQLVLAAAAAILLLSALGMTNAWRLVEGRLFDLVSTIAPARPPVPGAVIVAIDEPSMAEIGLQWPWPRDLHARLIRALRAAGAATIALDIVFAEPSSTHADQALAGAIGPDVVLASDLVRIEATQADQDVRVEPLALFQARRARSGLAAVVLDGDGVLRRIPPYRDLFAAAVLGRESRAPAPAGALIQFFGPARHYPTLSYYQALDPERFLPPGFFRGRTVIVGSALQDTPRIGSLAPDFFVSPYTVRSGLLTPGVEVQATIADNLRHGLFIRPLPYWLAVATLIAAVAAGAFLVRRPLNRRRAAGALLLTFAIVAGSWFALRFGRVWASPGLPMLGTLLIVGFQAGRDFASERRQRRFVMRAFGQYLAPDLVARLAQDPAALKLGGERRVLSILFCDIRNFTGLAERLQEDPERLTGLINRLLGPLSAAVLDHGGTIDKYIGDCVMAFWNAPLDDPDHARHAVACALRMLAEIERLNHALSAEGPDAPRIGIGIGINTGPCVVGNIGSDQRFDYSALGDAVNLASRLEGLSRLYSVPLLIGADTAELARGAFPLLELDRIVVKGRRGASAVFTVLPTADMPPTGQAGFLAEHAAMLAAYRARDWGVAESALARCRARAPSLAGYYDVVSGWIAELQQAPPGPHWQAVHRARDK